MTENIKKMKDLEIAMKFEMIINHNEWEKSSTLTESLCFSTVHIDLCVFSY